MNPVKLCLLTEVEKHDAKGLVARVAGKQRNIVVVRQDEAIYAYLNWCPHNQVLLDQIPGQFFNKDKTFLCCSKHGALFQINDGVCVEGPCEGEKLQELDCRVEDGIVYLMDQ